MAKKNQYSYSKYLREKKKKEKKAAKLAQKHGPGEDGAAETELPAGDGPGTGGEEE